MSHLSSGFYCKMTEFYEWPPIRVHCKELWLKLEALVVNFRCSCHLEGRGCKDAFITADIWPALKRHPPTHTPHIGNMNHLLLFVVSCNKMSLFSDLYFSEMMRLTLKQHE